MNPTATTTDPTSTGPVLTEHRTMNTVIHAAFRRDLRRVGDALGCFPAGSPTRARDLGAAWRNLAHQLHVHHVDEETLFWPAFVELGVDEGLIDALELEHGAMVAALTAAEASMEALGADPTAEHAAAARACVVELHRVLDDHLAHEERDLEPFGAAHVDTPQHKAAVARARTSHTEGVGTFFAWLSDTGDRRVAAALRREVPAPVLFVLTKVGGRRYRRLAAAAWGSGRRHA
jgi:hypothetical protein